MLLGGKPYKLRTDFRVGIEYATAAASGNLDVAAIFCLWFEGEYPPDEYASDAYEGINRFWRRKDEPIEKPKDEDDVSSGPIAFDFIADADIMQADFMRVYGIDLSTAEMHWWRFMALLEGLYSYSFKDRVRFRVQPLDGMDAKQRSRAVKLRNQFEIINDEEGSTFNDRVAYLDAIIEKHNKK